ncbi:AAA family ATPase [Pedobacter sp. SD-b]|uniref:AAA family ATPase n=1 Tax=Pedobacter segetis TaxID=2793069 RepID=A0ABS1BNQ0_9SPHI|nr:AAA domain-containing protein [Pedobacter segetis]MBK0384517.1 AAA family ATPase [Pedobacter segetis]
MKKDKYLQIFNYLLEFSKLRSNPVRDIESSDAQYPDKVWLADIPQYEIFDCITFPSYNEDADYWLKVTKPKDEPQQPTFKKLSETLNDWIVKDSLTDEDGTPSLKETIVKNGKTIALADQQELQLEFDKYLNEKWLNDLEQYKQEIRAYEIQFAEYERKAKTYKHLFSIYNKAQQFGEEFELIFGVGLLYFKEDSNTPQICRHILTSKAEISFEFSQRESFVKVSPSIDNEIQIETDAILDLFEQFDSADVIEAEKLVASFLKEKGISDNLFDPQIKDAIQIFADRIRPDGQSKEDLAKPKEVANKPTVYFAPALLLRKRNTRSFTALYEKIISEITISPDSIDIPSINDIIGVLQPEEDSEFSENGTSNSFSDETIYFPKKYNDEQIEIIEKARRNNKVLVQGPPGTGKSHTIANLICHLLANGKKVLVTAYTKRALEVLKNQLPKDFQNLTVNLLSGDSTSIQDLDSSVNAINDKLASITDLTRYAKEIEEREADLSLVKRDKAYTKNEWLKVKEKSTRRQNINQNYTGTLSEIAEKIEKEFSIFSWYNDDFADIAKIELVGDIKNFNALTRKYQSLDCNVFNFIIPKKDKLLSLSELQKFRKITDDLLEKYSSKEKHILIICKDYPALRSQLEWLYKLVLNTDNNALWFKSRIVNDFQNNQFFWTDKLTRTNKLISALNEEYLKQLDRSVEIKYLNDKSWIQLNGDAKILLNYLKEGNSLSGILFAMKKPLLPKNIKEKLYFIDSVKINGSPCDTQQEFVTVLNDIKLKQDFEELEMIWEIQPNENSKSYFDKFVYYKKIKDDADELIGIIRDMGKSKVQIESTSSVKITNYNSNSIKELIEETDYNYLLAQTKFFKGKLTDVQNYLSIQNIHPLANSIINTLANIDTEKYEQELSEIDILNSEKKKYNEYKDLQESLQKDFPTLVYEILQNTFDFSNFSNLDNAIYYKHAYSEITKLLEEDYETRLEYKLSDLERQEEKLISKIASKKAWLSVLGGLSNNFLLRQHLQAWVQAVKKIGKTGTGKRALKFRKEAQHQMEKCKDSVPCWIMPLYKVAETINPEQGMYDYVIIDEASQLGADAIFLLYISKNIIIVGDDKQTSPEYVGVDANTMTPHINRHLQNIPFANYYGTEFSFFDHAKRFCNGMTVLREHFRCMPEIIEFCNKHFYAPDGKGLYPLKQYSENRIEPLKTEYCQSGFVDGTYQNITNKVEAEGIANKIAELVNDENYKGKSFGVIALQGNKQATIIDNLILKKIGEVEYKNRNIVCGNSASFQGDERDIMFLSLITAHNHNRSALTKPEDERRFNVAVSRAKEQIWLYHSVQLDDMSNQNDLRYKLLDHFLNHKQQPIPPQKFIERSMGTQPEPFESWFEVDVFNDIVSNSYSVIPQYEVAKGRYRIDLVTLLGNGIKIAIECDGDKFHGAEQFQNDLMRQKVLERCGWQFFRVRGGEYYSNRKKAMQPLWKLLKANDIQIEEPQIKNNYQHSEVEETEIERNETAQSETIKQIIPRQDTIFEQSDLFETKKQVAMDFSNQPPIQTEHSIKTATNLFAFPEFLVFTSLHNVYKIQNRGFNSKAQVIEQIEFEETEKPIYLTGTKNYNGYLFVAFENGKAGKISFTSYQTEQNRKKLKNAYSNESKLVFIEHIENDIDLVALSSIDKVALFNTSKINPVDSRTSKGVQVMKPKDGSFMKVVKKLNQVKFNDPEYYRKDGGLNIVGYYLKQGDEI